jgi:hypothetical protein
MRTFARLAACIVALGAAGGARAQLQTQGLTVGAPPPQIGAPQTQTLAARTGLIAAVDVRARSFICRWRGRRWTFVTTGDTVFRRGPESASFAALKVGERVAVRYRTVAGRLIAQTVVIGP